MAPFGSDYGVFQKRRFVMTDFLYATPSFISGVGRVIDLGGTMTVFNESDSPFEADTRATFSDWSVTGNDIRGAFEEA
jgi:hypothetical protein